jgi:hypothetical protein
MLLTAGRKRRDSWLVQVPTRSSTQALDVRAVAYILRFEVTCARRPFCGFENTRVSRVMLHDDALQGSEFSSLQSFFATSSEFYLTQPTMQQRVQQTTRSISSNKSSSTTVSAVLSSGEEWLLISQDT